MRAPSGMTSLVWRATCRGKSCIHYEPCGCRLMFPEIAATCGLPVWYRKISSLKAIAPDRYPYISCPQDYQRNDNKKRIGPFSDVGVLCHCAGKILTKAFVNKRCPRKTDGNLISCFHNMHHHQRRISSQYLRIHVTCTANCKQDKFDPAVLRPGRLFSSHEFRLLLKGSKNSPPFSVFIKPRK